MQTHYYLKFVFEGDIRTVQRLREHARWLPSPRFELPEPVEDGPEPTSPPPVLEAEPPEEAAPSAGDQACQDEQRAESKEQRAENSMPYALCSSPLAELGAFLAQAKVVLDPERAGDLIPYPEVAPGLDRWLRMEFKLPGGIEDLKAAAPETQARVLLRMKAFRDFRRFLLKLGGGQEGSGDDRGREA
jgi:hypothetical protein